MSNTTNPLALQIRQANITESESAALEQAFAPFIEEAEQWRAKAESITVTSADDKEQIRDAKKTRIALKEIRCNVEKSRVKLKEESLRKGKAIDAVANFLKSLIAPLEERLQRQEDFAAIQEQKAKDALKERRTIKLTAFNVDLTIYPALADMPEETYLKLAESSRVAFQLAKDAALKAEEDRAAREKADGEERERMRVENERLKTEAAAKQIELDKERAAKQKLADEAAAKKLEEERIERERKAAEQKRLDDEKRALRAPDKEKLLQLADTITGFRMPDVSSKEAKVIVKNVIELLSKTSQYVKAQTISL